MDIFYKIRHKPTGKFWRPATGYRWEKNNLSDKGKAYTRKPNIKNTLSIIRDEDVVHTWMGKQEWKRIPLSEFEIVTYHTVEVDTHDVG